MRIAHDPSPVTCPVCGTAGPAPLVFGLPGGGLFEQAERGEVALAGCLVSDANPQWKCRNEQCRAEF